LYRVKKCSLGDDRILCHRFELVESNDLEITGPVTPVNCIDDAAELRTVLRVEIVEI
jgi:hypothetical protein